MYPISYTEKNGVVDFHYDPEELQEWRYLGENNGDVGIALFQIINKTEMVYKGYGTIENPSREEFILHLKHNSIFDGELQPPEWYLKPAAEERGRKYWEEFTKNMRIIFIDPSKE